MRKADIANQICEKVGIPKSESMDLVEYILNCLKATLQKGDAVKIAGFGNFMVRSKGERKGRNPRTRGTSSIRATHNAPLCPIPASKADVTTQC